MTRFWGLVGGGRGWSVFAKPRGFLRKASVHQPRPPNRFEPSRCGT